MDYQEQQYQMSDAELAQIVYQNPHPIFRTSRTGKILYSNPAAIILLETWRVEDKTSLPLNLMEKIPQPQDPLQTYQTEVTVEKAIYTCIYTPVNNTPDQFLLYLQDVTRERHSDLMKTEFVSLASHQLRTPLTALRWLSERLLKVDKTGPLNPKQEEISTHIRETALRLINLVNHLLNISRLETGRLVIDPQTVNLQELITQVIQDLDPVLEKSGHSVNLQIGTEVPTTISLDPLLTREIFTNLISNAAKYSPANTTIEVKLTTQYQEVLCQIADHGYGIPQEEHEKIFARFYRASNVANRDIEGSGLGLYMVKQIVETFGGRIWFDSNEEQGTSFFFTIPRDGTPARAGEVTLSS